MTKREMMKKAHEMARQMEGNYAARLALALRELWAMVKKGTKKEEKKTMVVLEKYEKFNFRRYSNPWVARLGKNGRPDFSVEVGGYTGQWNKGEAGELYIAFPVDGQLYAYGQKDYRKAGKGYTIVQYRNGEFYEIEKTDLVRYLEAM